MNECMQMALAVTLPDDETFSSYFGGDNAQVVSHLKQVLAQASSCDFQYSYLCGLADSGKSHLLYAMCVEAQLHGLSSFLISLKDFASFDKDILDNLEQMDVICIDDIHAIAGDKNWENALFNFYNRFNAPGKILVVAGDLLPDMLNIELPDLVSRLKWGTTFQIRSMSDDDKAEALVQRAKMRGLELPIECTRFLLTRVSRDMRALLDVLNRLDHASMVEKRKITIPFIKTILNL